MAGTEWIPAAMGPHVTICNARGAHNISTAEWTMTAILAMLKYLPLYLDIQRSGDLEAAFEASGTIERHHRRPRPHLPARHAGGAHREDRAARRLWLHRQRDRAHARAVSSVRSLRVRAPRARGRWFTPSLNSTACCRGADVIVLILPLTAESHGLIGPRQFALMRQGALLVNAARGPIVDTDALVDALNAGRIRAALDVTDPEPLPAGSPVMALPESADHAAHRWIEPAVCAARAEDGRRRAAPLHRRRAAAERGAGCDLSGGAPARRQSRRPRTGKHHKARIQHRRSPQIFVDILANIDKVHHDPQPPVRHVLARLPPACHQAVAGQRGIQKGQRCVQPPGDHSQHNAARCARNQPR